MGEQAYRPEYRNSWALVIGIDRYKEARLAPLETAVKGARAFADLLVEQFEFPRDNVILLENEQATQGAIRRVFTDPLGRKDKVGDDDRVVIYFGGHGVTYDTAEGDIGCITAYDTELAYWDTTIPMDELTRLANRSHAKHILFLLDACFSGYATTRSAQTGMQRQMEDYLTHPSRQVIAAGSRDQAVSDTWGPGGQSLFTGFLLEGLRGAAPAPGGLLRVYHLAGYLQDAVAQNSRSRQTPQYAALMGSEGGDFVFAVRPLGDLSTGLLTALDSADPAQRLSAVTQLRALVEGGDQKKADRAYAQLQQLAADSDDAVRASARTALRMLLPETSIVPLVREKLLATGPLVEPPAEPAAPRKVHAVLSVTDGPGKGWRYEMVDTALTIGRASDNVLSFSDDDMLSRYHARFEARGEGVWLVDLGSTNGTLVNQIRLEQPVLLKEGDRAIIGSTEFTVNLARAKAQDDLKATRAVIKFPPKPPDQAALAPAKTDAPTAKPINQDGMAGLRAARRLKGHSQGVTSVAWSPDGARLATGSLDKTVMVWEASGKQLRTCQGHTSEVAGVVWSPDGGRIASASWDSTAIVWDGTTGRRLRVLTGEARVLTSVVWSPDGSVLACGSRNGTISMWDSATVTHVRDLSSHTNRVHSLAWSSDGLLLASGAADKIVIIWDAISGDWLHPLEGHTSDVTGVAWSPDAQQVASGSLDGLVIIWEATTGKQVRKLEGGAGEVTSLGWSPEGNLLASGMKNGNIIVWDALSGKRLRVLDVHSQAVRSVAWSPDMTRLASASQDSKVIVWEVTG